MIITSLLLISQVKDVSYGETQDSIFLVRNINFFGAIQGFQRITDRLSSGDAFSLFGVYFLLRSYSGISHLLVPAVRESLFSSNLKAFFRRCQILSHEDIKCIERKEFVTEITVLVQKAFECISLSSWDASTRAKDIEAMQLVILKKLIFSPFLAKRVIGLSFLCDLIEVMEQSQRLRSRRVSAWISSDNLVSWIQENDIIDSILGANVHPELLKRTPSILKFLAQRDALTLQNLESLWNASVGQHESVIRSVYDTIVDLASCLSGPELDFIFFKIKALEISSFSELTLNFLKGFTFNAITRVQTENISDSVSGWFGLEMFWDFIQDSCPVSIDVTEFSFLALTESLSSDSCASQRIVYIMKCMDNLEKGLSVVQSLRLTMEIISSTGGSEKSNVAIIDKLITAIQSKRNILKLIQADSSRFVLEAHGCVKYDEQAQIQTRLKFLTFIFSSSSLELSLGFVESLWQVFSSPKLSVLNQSAFFNWLASLRSLRQVQSTGLATQIFDQLLCNPKLFLAESSSLQAFLCFYVYFIQSNVESQHLFVIDSIKWLECKNPDYKGRETLWKFACANTNTEVRRSARNLLVSLYVNSHDPSQKLRDMKFFVVDSFALLERFFSEGNSSSCGPVLETMLCFFDSVSSDTRVPTKSGDAVTQQYAISCRFMLPDRRGADQALHADIDSLKTAGFLRNELAKHCKVDPSSLRMLLRTSSGTRILWPDQDDDRTLMELGVVDDDTFVLTVSDKSPRSPPRKEISTLYFWMTESVGKFALLTRLLDDGGATGSLAWNVLERLPCDLELNKKVRGVCEGFKEWELLFGKSLFQLLHSLNTVFKVYFRNPSSERSVWLKKFCDSNGDVYLISILLTTDTRSFFVEPLLQKTLSLLLFLINSVFEWKSVQDSLSPSISLKRITEVCLNILSNAAICQDLFFPPATIGHNPVPFPHFIDEVSRCLQFVDRINDKLVYECIHEYEWFLILVERGLEKHSSELLRKKFFACFIALTRMNSSIAETLLKFVLRRVVEIDCNSTTCTEISSTAVFLFESVRFEELISQDPSFVSDSQKLLCRLSSHHSKESNQRIEDPVLIALLKVASSILKNSLTMTEYAMEQKLIDQILTNFLFDFPDPQSKSEVLPPMCKSRESRLAAFQMVLNSIHGRPGMISHVCSFFETRNHLVSHSGGNDPNEFDFHSSFDEKSDTGYVGIRNLGCICYMIALTQQLFMVPTFRSRFLSVEEPKPEDVSIDEEDLKKESTIYQLQYMLAYLQESEKGFYDPAPFCYAFKDIDNRPTDITVQKDSQEFLMTLFDRIDTKLTGTPWEKLLFSELGGTFANQFIGLESCRHRKERSEPFYCLTLNVKNKKNVMEGLDSFIEGEMLSGDNAYACEKCNAKVDTLKRVVIKDLPPTLIIHLKRFELDYETFQMIKLNDRCEFPFELNLKRYTREGIEMLSESASTSLDAKSDNDEDAETPLVNRPDWYYSYRLTGVLIHVGHANAGHYYSFIKERPDPLNPFEGSKWFEFNDHLVTPFDPASIPDQCFGGEQQVGLNRVIEKRKNAYLLFYSRLQPNDKALSDSDWEVVESKSQSSLFSSIWEENYNFWRDKYIFDQMYFEFINQMLRDFERSTSVSSEITVPVCAFLTRCLFETVSRFADKSMFAPWARCLLQMLEADINCDLWFLETFSSLSRWAYELILICPYESIRRVVAESLVIALRQISVCEAAEAHQTVLVSALDALVSLLPDVGVHGPGFNQYFRILHQFCQSNPRNTELLWRRYELGVQMTHLVLGDRSRTPDAFVLNPQMHFLYLPEVSCLIDFQYYFLCLQRLLLCSSADVAAGGNLFFNNIKSPEFISFCLPNCPPSFLDEFIQFLVNEDKALTDSLLLSIIDGIEQSDGESLKPYFDALRCTLQVSDSLSNYRLETFLSSTISSVQLNSQFYSATFVSIDEVLKLALQIPAVAGWCKQNSPRLLWIVEWLQKFGVGGRSSSSSGIKLTKPVKGSRKNSRHQLDVSSKSTCFSATEMSTYLSSILKGKVPSGVLIPQDEEEIKGTR